MSISRREVLKLGSVAGAGFFLYTRFGVPQGVFAQADPSATLDPVTIAKYQTPLVIPPAMPRTAQTSEGIDYYEIAVRQFQQQILPSGHPATTVWSYGSINHPASFNYPAFTVEAQFRRPVRVRWINQLVDGNGRYLPHLLPVDPTLHWANPPGPIDERPTFGETPGPYLGPVPIVVHLHGGNSTAQSDGYAEAWYLPAASNLGGFELKGSFYASPYGSPDDYLRGQAAFQYANDQRAATLWFHDHTLGMTRLNVYAGPAGFYILRGGDQDLPPSVLPGPAPALGDPPARITTAFRSRSRTGPSTATARCSIRTAGRSSTNTPAHSFRVRRCRRSGTRSSSATPWWSMARLGRCSRSSGAATASASSTATPRAS